jgi:hypothetical protein
VVFRLTEEEYGLLKAACSAAGQRNLSEYTRSELLLGLRSDKMEVTLQNRFQEIDHKLQYLGNLLQEVIDCLQLGSGRTHLS